MLLERNGRPTTATRPITRPTTATRPITRPTTATRRAGGERLSALQRASQPR